MLYGPGCCEPGLALFIAGFSPADVDPSQLRVMRWLLKKRYEFKKSRCNPLGLVFRCIGSAKINIVGFSMVFEVS